MSIFTPKPASHGHRPKNNLIVLVAVGSDLVVALVKFAAAAFTGSSAMLSEGIHSMVDVLTGVLLLYGARVSHHPSTSDHQVGFGREVFFWNFIVALAILALGAGVALVEGIKQFLTPRAIEAPIVSYCVLAVAFVSEAVSLYSAARGVGLTQGRRSLRNYVRTSRDATSLTVLFSSASGMMGLLAAGCGTVLSSVYKMPQFDGVASIVIAAILGVTALFLARNSKDLLIGVPASKDMVSSILAIASANALVHHANGSLSVHIAPDQILVALSVEFLPEGTTATIEKAIADIDVEVRHAHPEVVIFIIKPQSPEQFQSLRKRRGW
jgi:cation diffusion facilitator family transporter